MLQLKNVSFFYNKGSSNEIKALSDINLTVKENEFISVLGSNGSGKSTLAHLLNGLLKPHLGSIEIDELKITLDSDLLSIKEKVQLLFQNPDSQIIATIVEEDVAFGPENLGLSRQEINKRIDNSLKAVGMAEFRKNEPHSLSVGQKQKVALASVLAMKPKYLILDEPSSYLDPISRREMLELLKKIRREEKITVVNITHYPNQIFYSERIILLDEGKIIFDGGVDDFFKDRKALAATNFPKPLWMEIKKEYKQKIKQLSDVDSNEKLGDILCSLN